MFDLADVADDVDAAAEAAIVDVLHAGPGPVAAALLAGTDPRRLSAEGQVRYLQAWEELASWVAAGPMAGLVHFVGAADVRASGDDVAVLDQASRTTEVGLVLNLSDGAVEARVETARELCSRLPATFHALRTGRLSYWHARAMVEAVKPVPSAEAVARVEQRVLARQLPRTVAEFRRSARAAVDAVDPDAALRRHLHARERRCVRRWPLPDGMACLQVEAPAPAVETMWASLTVLAGSRFGDDTRPLDARRADALLSLCLSAVATDPADDGAPPVAIHRPRTPVQAHIVVDLPTVLGLAENPAELRGYGPIPATLAREWLDDATTWRRLVTDPVRGHLLDYGPVVRSAPPKLRDFVNSRSVTCAFPRCQRRAHECDLDHEPAWRADGTGGHTSAADLRPLCRRHHRFKTFLGWRIAHREGGGASWTTPTGMQWDADPPPVLDDD